MEGQISVASYSAFFCDITLFLIALRPHSQPRLQLSLRGLHSVDSREAVSPSQAPSVISPAVPVRLHASLTFRLPELIEILHCIIPSFIFVGLYLSEVLPFHRGRVGMGKRKCPRAGHWLSQNPQA